MSPLLPKPDRHAIHLAQHAVSGAARRCYVQNASLEIAWCRVVTETGTIAGERVVPFFTEGIEGFDQRPEGLVVRRAPGGDRRGALLPAVTVAAVSR